MRTILTALAIIPIASVSFAQEHEGHNEYHNSAYSHWIVPGTNVSCCDARRDNNGELVGDCYPTEFRLGKDGWEALLDPRTNDGKHVWIALPEDKRLKEKNPDQTGRSGHLCENIFHAVLCWVPPTGTL